MRSLICALILISAPALALKPGDSLPQDLAAKNQNGKTVELAKFHKQFVLVYFYPKDDTPGCTVEAQKFQADFDKFEGLNAVILGVSRQDQASHQKFIAKHSLKFDLLVDSDGKFSEAFGVGTVPVLGLHKRQSVLIGPEGKVIKFYDNVDPKIHAEEVLKDIAIAKGKI